VLWSDESKFEIFGSTRRVFVRRGQGERMVSTCMVPTVKHEMDRRVKAKGPTGAQHLWELLQDCWKTVSGDYLMKLIERMPSVCKAVIDI